jgi:stage V sporulation protein S
MTTEGRAPMEVLKAAATSKPVLVAGAIAGVIRRQSRAEIHAIGAGAVNQAIKAIAISRGCLTLEGLDLVCIPSRRLVARWTRKDRDQAHGVALTVLTSFVWAKAIVAKLGGIQKIGRLKGPASDFGTAHLADP